MRLSDYSHEHLTRAKATLFARYVQQLCLNGGFTRLALQSLFDAEPRSDLAPLLQKALDTLETKAASVGSSTNWGTPLSYANELAAAFMTLVQAESFIGQIPGMQKVPAGLPVLVSTTSGTAYWVTEAAPKPITTLTPRAVTVPIAKAAAIVSISKDLLHIGPGAADLVRNDLSGSVAAFVDAAFVNPAIAPSPGVPGSITNGTTPLVATGVPATDVPVLLASFYAARPNAARPVLLVNPATNTALALGKIDPGMPIVVSPHVGTLTIVLDAAAVHWAGTADIGLTLSENALLQVSDTPDNPVTASTVYRSMFQENAVALRAEWWVSWARADVTAVKYSA